MQYVNNWGHVFNCQLPLTLSSNHTDNQSFNCLFKGAEDDLTYTCLELCDVTLDVWITTKKNEENWNNMARELIQQLLGVLQYLHLRGVLHCDLCVSIRSEQQICFKWSIYCTEIHYICANGQCADDCKGNVNFLFSFVTPLQARPRLVWNDHLWFVPQVHISLFLVRLLMTPLSEVLKLNNLAVTILQINNALQK